MRPLPQMRATVLLSALAGASAGAVELKMGTFDAEVKNSGKNAFVKFLAPWWYASRIGHRDFRHPAFSARD